MPTTEGTPPGKGRRGLGRAAVRNLMRFGVLGAGLWLGVVALLYIFQSRLIFPGSLLPGDPDAPLDLRPGVEFVRLKTARGVPLVACFGTALRAPGLPAGDRRGSPTLLYFYGNGSNLVGVLRNEFETFRRLGLNVLAVDYEGYGMSRGAPSEAGCYATADAAYDYLGRRADVDPRTLLVGGWSLGGAVAIDLAARRPVGGLAAFCTFTSMAEMTNRRYPFVPARVLLRHRFDSVVKIGKVRCPILLGCGDRDRSVPPSMTPELAAAAAGRPVRVFSVAGAGHNNFYEVGDAQVGDELRAFVRRLAANP